MKWLAKLKDVAGLDRAIAYTMLARCFQIVGSAGTVLLILRFMTQVEQGYYYTLLSLVAIQTIFELGFSFVILQMAAHESVGLNGHLAENTGGIAYSRLASVLKKAIRWYIAAAIVFVSILFPLGIVFFSKHAQQNGAVPWHGPWVSLVAATAVLFTVNPVVSFLEGCGQIRQVAGMRFVQGLTAIIIPWTAISLGHGLYSPALVNTGYALVGLGFIWSKRSLLLPLLRHKTAGAEISWRTEVWPFQWRIAVSYLCMYLTVQVMTPILFAYRGAVEAGRLGMSISISGYVWSVVIAWMTTKATPFGAMVARGEFEELDRLFFSTFKRSFVVLLAIVSTCMIGVIAVQHVLPAISTRIVSPTLFAFLLLTAMSNFVVQSLAIYLRAHKSEPFLGQSMLVAALTFGGALLAVPHWGIKGAAAVYFLSAGVVGLVVATMIFNARRNEKLQHAPAPAMEERV